MPEFEQTAQGSDEPTSKLIDDQKVNEIVGCNESSDQYILLSSGEITFEDSSELFDNLRNNEIVFASGIEGVIPSMSR